MIYHSFKTVPTPGTAVPLKSTPGTKASFITIYPRTVSGTPNAGEVRIGGIPSNTENNSGTAIPPGSGIPLQPGDSSVVWPMQAVNPIDLNTVYVDADNANDGIQFVYGRP